MGDPLCESIRAYVARPWQTVADAGVGVEDAFYARSTPLQRLQRLDVLARFGRECGACVAAQRQADVDHQIHLLGLLDVVARLAASTLR